jgi:8-oxo-dGTP diphosphatase
MRNTAAEGALLVAVGVIVGADGRILLSQRRADRHLGGKWEFPGGKVEPGESVVGALERELGEELGIRPLALRPLIRVDHPYPEKRVLLDVWRVDRYGGQPAGLEGQPIVWVAAEELADYPLPEADRPIVTACRLPATCLITPDPGHSLEEWWLRFESSLTAGERLVQLRAPSLGGEQLERVVVRAAELTARYGAALLLNCGDSIEQALRLVECHALAGLHLTGRALASLSERPLARTALLSASCHSPAELALAERIGADFALLSPVEPTTSHPLAEPIGWRSVADWIEGVNLPVYALGGMHPGLLEDAWRHGAQGIAAISSLWRT